MSAHQGYCKDDIQSATTVSASQMVVKAQKHIDRTVRHPPSLRSKSFLRRSIEAHNALTGQAPKIKVAKLPGIASLHVTDNSMAHVATWDDRLDVPERAVSTVLAADVQHVGKLYFC